MIWLALALFVVGLLLSAFFSGSETGFYRVTRVRLVLDGLSGDPIAKGLHWLTNNPSLFVATTLVGNNLANYLTSLAVVLATGVLFTQHAHLVEMIAPVALAPFLFVYGEALPKNLFYHAPNLLLRRTGPLFLLFVALFAPISALLWTLGQMLQWFVGESPARVQLALARKELSQVLDEGHAAGILRPSQRHLAQGLFAIANQTVAAACVPAARVTTVRIGDSVSDVYRLARRQKLSAIPVIQTVERKRRWVGYVRMIDLALRKRDQAEAAEEPTIQEVLPMLDIQHTETQIAALIRMQTARAMLARVVDERGKTIGILSGRQLSESLFHSD